MVELGQNSDPQLNPIVDPVPSIYTIRLPAFRSGPQRLRHHGVAITHQQLEQNPLFSVRRFPPNTLPPDLLLLRLAVILYNSDYKLMIAAALVNALPLHFIQLQTC
ncbi:hypothetical protein SLE2022_310890 [Rubroshorea leprosula]